MRVFPVPSTNDLKEGSTSVRWFGTLAPVILADCWVVACWDCWLGVDVDGVLFCWVIVIDLCCSRNAIQET